MKFTTELKRYAIHFSILKMTFVKDVLQLDECVDYKAGNLVEDLQNAFYDTHSVSMGMDCSY